MTISSGLYGPQANLISSRVYLITSPTESSSADDKSSLTLKILENKLFPKGYDRKQAEPISLLTNNHIPMLLIQSRHDGIVDSSFAEDFRDKAHELGMQCELYEVTDDLNTHSWYTAGVFVKNRRENKSLDKFWSWVEER